MSPNSQLRAALTALAQHADSADGVPAWPAASWEALRRAGVLGWMIPSEYGGQGRDGVELLAGYESLASACLTTAFLLSQREAACRRIRDGDNAALARELLPRLAKGECFATVGLSQLTTSRQHQSPALVARQERNGIVLDGSIPWVSGAPGADYIVVGAALEPHSADNLQVLVVMPRTTPGVEVQHPLALAALQGSMTAEVRCNQVYLERKWLLAGPCSNVMAGNRGGTGGLETSCLAIGLSAAAIKFLADESVSRPELHSCAEQLQGRCVKLRREMHRQATESSAATAAGELRAQANLLVLSATQAALTAAKGAGFVRGHPAQRWARQALFFLVWSCPRPAAETLLQQLAASCELQS